MSIRKDGLAALVAVALSLLFGCSAASDEKSSAPGRGAGPSATALRAPVAQPEPLERARALALREPRLRALFGRAGRLESTNGGVRSKPSARADVSEVRFLAGATRSIEFRAGRLNAPLATLDVSGDADAPGAVERGVLRYPHAPGVTGFWIHAKESLEQLLLLEAPGSTTLDWKLTLHGDIASVHEDRGGLLFLDADGRGRLRMPRAYAVDAAGSKIPIRFAWSVDTRGPEMVLTVQFQLPRDLRLPALVDPALAVVFWQEQHVTGPAGRWDYGFVYHPIWQKSVLFGGVGSCPAQDGSCSDTWTYDGKWQRAPAGGAPTRQGPAMTYTLNPPGVLVFGGKTASTNSAETWFWNGTAWTRVATTGPSARSQAKMVFAPVLGKAVNVPVLVGGADIGGDPHSWTWNGSSWSALSDNSPGADRLWHSLVYDTHRKSALLFGGRTASMLWPDLWGFDGTKWTLLDDGPPDPPDASAPVAREGAAMAFDTDRNVAILFGGSGFDNYYEDTWEWDSATGTWAERTGLDGPFFRSDASMVYDAHRKRAVLFGGLDNVELDDTWEYGALAGTCSSSANCAGFPCVDGACCEKAQCGPCEACSSTSARCEPVLGREDPNSCSGDHTCDAAGACKKKNGIACASGAECVSGNCADGVCCTSACTGACERCDSSEAPGVCSFVSGSAYHGSCPGAPPCGATCPGDSPACVYPNGSPCGSSCNDSKITTSSCNGSGQCQILPPKDCPNGFACKDGQQCAVDCEDNTDCGGDLICRARACVPASATCKDATTQLDENNQAHSCGEYACRSGKCLTSCTSPADCAPNLICDSAHRCVRNIAASSSGDSGCGCRFSGTRTRLPACFALFALALACSRRRRGRTVRAGPGRRREARARTRASR